MKFVMCVILLTGLTFGQFATINKTCVRGAKQTLTWVMSGDYSAAKLSFVVKASGDLNAVSFSNRVIQKLNSLAGGDSTQLYADYSGGNTTITVNILPTDDEILAAKTWVYDIVSTNVSDTTNKTVIVSGNFVLTSGVQTPYDGYSLPSNATHIITIDADTLNSYLKKGTITWDSIH